MSFKSIELNLIVTTKNFQILDVKLNRQISPNDLHDIVIPKVNSAKGVILSGRGPVWLSQYFLSKLIHVPWFAQFDPRFGALITSSKKPELFLKKIRLNNIVKFFPRPELKPQIIAFLGPPHSGKSVFLYALHKALLKENFNFFNEELFIIKGAPDGEGIWSSEIPQNLVQVIRYKNKFNSNFVRNVIRQIQNISKTKSFLFVDCGGKLDEFNLTILKYCNSVIFFASKKVIIREWKEYFKNVKPLAEVTSILKDGKPKINKRKDGILEITMYNLSRDNHNIQIPHQFLQNFNKE